MSITGDEVFASMPIYENMLDIRRMDGRGQYSIAREISVEKLVDQCLQSAEHTDTDIEEDYTPSHQSEDTSDMAKITKMKSSGYGCQLQSDEVFASMTINKNMLDVRRMEGRGQLSDTYQ